MGKPGRKRGPSRAGGILKLYRDRAPSRSWILAALPRKTREFSHELGPTGFIPRLPRYFNESFENETVDQSNPGRIE